MLYAPIPVPEVTQATWVEFELASMSLERAKSVADREPLEFDFSSVDLSLLEKAGLL